VLDADVLPRKHLTQIDPALVADPPAVRDGARPVVERVGQRRQAGGSALCAEAPPINASY